jgi:hypothetical protein
MAELRKIEPAPRSELESRDCPWCGSKAHGWAQCGRVSGMKFFGEYEGPADIQTIAFFPKYKDDGALEFEPDPDFWSSPSDEDEEG